MNETKSTEQFEHSLYIEAYEIKNIYDEYFVINQDRHA